MIKRTLFDFLMSKSMNLAKNTIKIYTVLILNLLQLFKPVWTLTDSGTIQFWIRNINRALTDTMERCVCQTFSRPPNLMLKLQSYLPINAQVVHAKVVTSTKRSKIRAKQSWKNSYKKKSLAYVIEDMLSLAELRFWTRRGSVQRPNGKKVSGKTSRIGSKDSIPRNFSRL